jgi:hypothetical protein
MATGTEEPQVRTYGHWRRPSSVGVLGFGTIGTGLVIVAGAVSAVLATVSLVSGLVCGVVSAAVLVLVLRKDEWDRSLLEKGAELVAWKQAQWRGWHIYRSGPLGVVPSGACQLPGIAARLEVFEAVDAMGERFCVLTHPKTRHVTTVIQTRPEGLGLVDQDTVDARVAQYAGWLNMLGVESGLVSASITIEASPDPGFRLARELERVHVPSSPPVAAGVVRELAETPVGLPQVTGWAALTWTAQSLGGRKRPIDEVVLEIAARLPILRGELEKTGAGTARSMTLPELSGVIRSAFDPSVAATIQEVGANNADVAWEDCGPLEAEEHRGFYTHDGHLSVSWEMGVAPRGTVRETVLESLLQPHGRLPIKRFTMHYRPFEPHEAAAKVDNDVLVAHTNAQSRGKGRMRARDLQTVRAAEKTAEEEASGAGLTRFGAVVTVTVPDGDRVGDRAETLREIEAVVQSLGQAARLRLRRPMAGQAVAFLAGLPLGLVLGAHSNVSQALRDLR